MPEIEVSSDGKTVWVNGQEKSLARFCKFSTEYFFEETGQNISCNHTKESLPQDWEDFVDSIKYHFNVDVSEHKPLYVR